MERHTYAVVDENGKTVFRDVVVDVNGYLVVRDFYLKFLPLWGAYMTRKMQWAEFVGKTAELMEEARDIYQPYNVVQAEEEKE